MQEWFKWSLLVVDIFLKILLLIIKIQSRKPGNRLSEKLSISEVLQSKNLNTAFHPSCQW